MGKKSTKGFQKLVSAVFILLSGFTTQILATPLDVNNDHNESPNITLGAIENATRTKLTDVQVIHRPTGALVGFSPILPGKRAELGIPSSKLRADIAIISWTQLGEKHTITLDMPKKPIGESSSEMMLLYTVHPSGHVTAELKGM